MLLSQEPYTSPVQCSFSLLNVISHQAKVGTNVSSGNRQATAKDDGNLLLSHVGWSEMGGWLLLALSQARSEKATSETIRPRLSTRCLCMRRDFAAARRESKSKGGWSDVTTNGLGWLIAMATRHTTTAVYHANVNQDIMIDSLHVPARSRTRLSLTRDVVCGKPIHSPPHDHPPSSCPEAVQDPKTSKFRLRSSTRTPTLVSITSSRNQEPRRAAQLSYLSITRLQLYIHYFSNGLSGYCHPLCKWW